MNERGCESVGIDLGTTYSSLAYIDKQGDARIVQDSGGQAVTPSVVFFDEDEVIVGDFALQQAKLHADRVVQFVKTHMGDEWKFEIDGQVHTPESISAIVLAHLVREAEPQIGPITSAVITVPAYFTEKRRRATQQAGEIAGLNVIGTLNEPMAAALAYGLYQQQEEQFAVVYDLGGGTFDVTVVRITPNELEEMATLGNRRLGGKDWDQCLVEHVANEFQQQFGKDPRESQQALQDLLIACEQAKRQLGRMKKAPVRLSAFGHDLNTSVTRDEFEAMTAHLLQTTKLTTEMAIQDAGLDWDRINHVVLVGGSTHMPMVRNMLQQISSREPHSGVNPVLAVALGAARYAQMLQAGTGPRAIGKEPGDDDGQDVDANVDSQTMVLPSDSLVGPVGSDTAELPKVRFVTAHGVGVKAALRGKEANVVLIHKNTPVPCSVSRQFKTFAKGGQARTLAIDVTQGDTPNIDLAELLGRGRIEGLPPNEEPGQPVQVTMQFDPQGRLQVHAVYVKTGQDLRFDLKIPGGLAEEDVDRYRQLLREAGLVGHSGRPTAEELEQMPLPSIGFDDLDFDDIEVGDSAKAVVEESPAPPPTPAAASAPTQVEEPFVVDPEPPLVESVEPAAEKVLGFEDLEVIDDEEDLEVLDEEDDQFNFDLDDEDEDDSVPDQPRPLSIDDDLDDLFDDD